MLSVVDMESASKLEEEHNLRIKKERKKGGGILAYGPCIGGVASSTSLLLLYLDVRFAPRQRFKEKV